MFFKWMPKKEMEETINFSTFCREVGILEAHVCKLTNPPGGLDST